MKPDLPAIEARAANMVGVLGWWGPVPKTIRQDMLDLLEYIKELEADIENMQIDHSHELHALADPEPPQ